MSVNKNEFIKNYRKNILEYSYPQRQKGDKKNSLNFRRSNTIYSNNGSSIIESKKNKLYKLNDSIKIPKIINFSQKTRNKKIPFNKNKSTEFLFSNSRNENAKIIRKMVYILEKSLTINKNDSSLTIDNLTKKRNPNKKFLFLKNNKLNENIKLFERTNFKKKLDNKKFKFLNRVNSSYLPYQYKGMQKKFQRCFSISNTTKLSPNSSCLLYMSLKKERINNIIKSYYDKFRGKNYIFISYSNNEKNKNSNKKEKSVNTDDYPSNFIKVIKIPKIEINKK